MVRCLSSTASRTKFTRPSTPIRVLGGELDGGGEGRGVADWTGGRSPFSSRLLTGRLFPYERTSRLKP